MSQSKQTLRCAVYTRKSSEEGLEQAFNSLDAQREAGLDYIRSQKHQGWRPVKTEYSDGGYSGGTTDRPGLQKMLADIRSGLLDVVVVYKVDRLSRSLADFANLMRIFDEHNVSFVSVTQQFSTTTSMGRLTLNMLLCFAQFEREVTGERIRDKIAATKRKGVWVGGQPPLGYRVSRPDEAPGDRRLRIIEEEAKAVRMAFEWYAKCKSPLEVAQRLNQAGHRTREVQTGSGHTEGGKPFSASFVKRILANPTYRGKITHGRGSGREIYDGLHEPIIDEELWERTRPEVVDSGSSCPPVWTEPHLLKGKIRTAEGYAMSPASVLRKNACKDGSSRERRVRYYCSQKALKKGYRTCTMKTLNARQLDDLVRAMVLDHIADHWQVNLRLWDASRRDQALRDTLIGVIVSPERLEVQLDRERIGAIQRQHEIDAASKVDRTTIDPGSTDPVPRCVFGPEVHEEDESIQLVLKIALKRHDGKRVLVSEDGHGLIRRCQADGTPIPQPALVRAIGQAYGWLDDIRKRGQTIEEVAAQAGLTAPRVSYLLHLTRLGPAVVRAVLTGTIDEQVTIKDLHKAADHLDWSLQAAALNFNE